MEEHVEYLSGESPIKQVVAGTVSDVMRTYNTEIWAGLILFVVLLVFIVPKLKSRSQVHNPDRTSEQKSSARVNDQKAFDLEEGRRLAILRLEEKQKAAQEEAKLRQQEKQKQKLLEMEEYLLPESGHTLGSSSNNSNDNNHNNSSSNNNNNDSKSTVATTTATKSTLKPQPRKGYNPLDPTSAGGSSRYTPSCRSKKGG